MDALKRAARAYLPSSVLAAYRRSKIEIPIRLRDAAPDLVDSFRDPSLRLPPARLRRRVGRTSSRREYVDAGALAASEILRAYEEAAASTRHRRWLDFGCGPGRIGRHVVGLARCERLVGVDVDPLLIAWARKHVPAAQFELIEPMLPMVFGPAEFDVVYAASVFTHFSETQQQAWLSELARVVAPGGLLIASTHSEHLADSRPDLSAGELARLACDGFAFGAGRGAFNDNTAFHSRAYLERTWGVLFRLRHFQAAGLFRYQDVGVWEVRRG